MSDNQTPTSDIPPAYRPAAAYPQSAFTYPSAPAVSAPPRSRGKRIALLIAGAVVVAAILFGGGFWVGIAASPVPGISDGRFGDNRMGPGGPPRPGDGFPGRGGEPDSDTGTDGSTDSSVLIG
ncbi:hypothetical protein L1277_001376 [Okibacterium sp. HSC-33S16]|nr:hypothetical protein [Okibacterium sp. HSC-33S16]